MYNLFEDSPQTPYFVATSQLNYNKSQTTGFHKTRDIRAGNLRIDCSNNSQ